MLRYVCERYQNNPNRNPCNHGEVVVVVVQYLSTVSIYRLVSVRGTLWMLGVGLTTIDLIKRNGKEVVEWYSKSHCACELNMLSIVSLRLVGTVCLCTPASKKKQALYHPKQYHQHQTLAMSRNSSSYASQLKSPSALYIRSSHPSCH
jgi:hypothetical protein